MLGVMVRIFIRRAVLFWVSFAFPSFILPRKEVWTDEKSNLI